jgi:hypothetical protein
MGIVSEDTLHLFSGVQDFSAVLDCGKSARCFVKAKQENRVEGQVM